MRFFRWHSSAVVLLLALTSRLLWLAAQWLLGSGSVRSYHVQTAAVWWIAAAAVAVALQPRNAASETLHGPDILPRWLLPMTLTAAVLLYARAFAMGFLSDDFILRAQALQWNFSSLSVGAFRPVPLAIWAGVLHVAGAAVPLHAINILLHGLNAWLAARLALRWTADRRVACAAAALMVVNPLAVEPVVWPSGVFDVFATTCLLSAVLNVPEARASAGRWLRFGVLACVAVLSKETAVMLPALVACDALARRARTSSVLPAIVISGALAGIYALARLYTAFGVASPPSSRYVLQRALFSAFGSLAMPVHERVVSAMPWLAMSAIALVIVVVTWSCASGRWRSRVRVPAAAVLWILASILPVFPILVVGSDLQASRYLYLAAPAWATLLAWLFETCAASSDRARPIVYGLLIALAAANAMLAWQHQSPWREAAAMRDHVLAAARADTAMRACATVDARDLPDHVGGAYVFRNGAPEAFAEWAGVQLTLDASPSCTFKWNGASFVTK